MRTISYVIVALMAIALGIYEASLLGSLPDYFKYFHPIIPLIVLFFALKRPQAGYLLAAISGLIPDLISAVPTGFATARLLLTALAVDFISENIVTNKSLYGSVALVTLARVVNYVLLFFAGLFYLYILERRIFYHDISTYLLIMGIDMLMISILFLSTTVFTKRFLTYIPFIKDKYGG